MRILRPAVFPVVVICACASTVPRLPEIPADAPVEFSGAQVVVLLDSINMEFKEEGGAGVLLLRETCWYKIKDPLRVDFSPFETNYSGYIEKVPRVGIMAFYADGSHKKLNSAFSATNEEVEYPYSLHRHKTSFREISMEIPDNRRLAGAIITVNRKIVRPEEYGVLCMRTRYPTLKKVIIFSYPSKYRINYGFENTEGIFCTTAVNDGPATHRTVTVIGRNLQPLGEDINCKYPEAWYAGFHVSLPPAGDTSYSWKEIGAYYLGLWQQRLCRDDTAAIDAAVKKIQAASEEELLRKCYEYVRNTVRYYGSWEEEFGWIPRTPSEVVEKGYGDCKEMAWLLANMFSKAGIRAWPALVQTEGFQVRPEYPSIECFNHVIVCAERKNGNRLFFDPTNKRAAWHSSHYNLIGQKVLVLDPDSAFIDTISAGARYRNRIHSVSRFSRGDPGQPLRLSGVIGMRGQLAEEIKTGIQNGGSAKESDILREYLKASFGIVAEKAGVTIIGDDSISITYSADASSCLVKSGQPGILFSQPAICTPEYHLSDLSYEGDRFLRAVEQTDVWTLPEEYKMTAFSDLHSFYGNGAWSLNGTTVTRSYKNDFVRINASARDSLRSFFKERQGFSNGVIWSR